MANNNECHLLVSPVTTATHVIIGLEGVKHHTTKVVHPLIDNKLTNKSPPT